MEALHIPEIAVGVLLRCDRETDFAFSMINRRLREMYTDDYYWRGRLERDFPLYDTSSHEGESFRETHWLISDRDLSKIIRIERVDLFIYFDLVSDHLDEAIYCNSTKILRWAVDNGHRHSGELHPILCSQLSIETMAIVSEFNLCGRWYWISNPIFYGTKEQIRFLLDRGLTDTDGLRGEMRAMKMPVSEKRREVIEYGLRELYDRRLLDEESEHEAILLFGEEERFNELPICDYYSPMFNLMEYVFLYGPDASVDWLLKESMGPHRLWSILTPDRMNYLLKRGLTIDSHTVSTIADRNPNLLLCLVDSERISDRQLLITLAKMRHGEGHRGIKLLLDRGFTVDGELMNELCNDPQVSLRTKMFIEDLA